MTDKSQIHNKMDTHVSPLKGNSEHQHVLIFSIRICNSNKTRLINS